MRGFIVFLFLLQCYTWDVLEGGTGKLTLGSPVCGEETCIKEDKYIDPGHEAGCNNRMALEVASLGNGLIVLCVARKD